MPVGEAWNLAFDTGFADTNPYDGIDAGKVDLWTWDAYHASALGYYLEALVIFGSVTGLDPMSLGPAEVGAAELGFSRPQTATLQRLAHDALGARSAALRWGPRPAPRHDPVLTATAHR